MDREPSTAIEASVVVIGKALEQASREYDKLSTFSIIKKAYMKGVITTLTLTFEMLHDLHHKYDNKRGEWN